MSKPLIKGKVTYDDKLTPFRFTSYGVRVEVTSNRQRIIDDAEAVARRSLLNDLKPYKGKKVDHFFELIRTDSGTCVLIQNGNRITYGRSMKRFLHFFDSIIRVSVGEYAVGLVFMHSGVVAWKGKAILIPAASFKGKSTLVTELVRRGAEYYSDEYAIIDANGMVSPFARPIARRADDGKFTPYHIEPESIGAKIGRDPIPIGTILLTDYKRGAKWRPEFLTPGICIMELMQHTLPIRYAPEFSLDVLNKITRRAIIIRSQRGNAKTFSGILLEFIDNLID